MTCCIRPTYKWTWVDAVDRHLCKKLDKVKLKNITVTMFDMTNVFSGFRCIFVNLQLLLSHRFLSQKSPLGPWYTCPMTPKAQMRLWKYT